MMRRETGIVVVASIVIGTLAAIPPLVSVAVGIKGSPLPTVPPLEYLAIVAVVIALGWIAIMVPASPTRKYLSAQISYCASSGSTARNGDSRWPAQPHVHGRIQIALTAGVQEITQKVRCIGPTPGTLATRMAPLDHRVPAQWESPTPPHNIRWEHRNEHHQDSGRHVHHR